MGFMAVAGRVGGMVCPFFLTLDSVWPGLQFAVLGILAATAGLLNIGLPETIGKPMPTTIQDVLALKNATKVSLFFLCTDPFSPFKIRVNPFSP